MGLAPVANYLVLWNDTSNTLWVTAPRGSNLKGVCPLQQIGPGQSAGVAYFQAGAFDDDWDWLYLSDPSNKTSTYQLYVRSNQLAYAQDFGYRNDSSSKSEPNPSPFPPGTCSMVQFPPPSENPDIQLLVYRLLTTPPPGGTPVAMPEQSAVPNAGTGGMR